MKKIINVILLLLFLITPINILANDNFVTVAEFVIMAGADVSIFEDIDGDTPLSGGMAAVIVNSVLGFEPSLVPSTNDMEIINILSHLPLYTVGSALVLLDLQMVYPQLISSETIKLYQAEIFIEALNRATMFLDSPFTLRQARPQDDFWMYVNRVFLANAEVSEYNTEVLRTVEPESFDEIFYIILNEVHEEGSFEHNINILYNMLTDYENITAGLATIDEIVSQIRNISSIEELIKFGEIYAKFFPLVNFLNFMTIADSSLGNTYWSVEIEMSGFSKYFYNWLSKSLDEYAYYFASNVLEFLGETEDLDIRSHNVASFILDLVHNVREYTTDDENNINISWDYLLQITPNSQILSLDTYAFELMKSFNAFTTPVALRAIELLDTKFTYDNLQVLKDIVKYSLVLNLIDNHIFGATISILIEMHREGYTEEEISVQAMSSIQQRMPQIFNLIYLDKYANDEARNYVISLADRLLNTWSNLLYSNDWISYYTINNALKKIDLIRIFVSHVDYGEPWPQPVMADFDKVIMGGNFAYWLKAQNLANRDFFIINNLNNSSGMPYLQILNFMPNVPNAVYSALLNASMIPHGKLTYPYFGLDRTREQNLAGIGSTIAHEIGHGFDYNGIRFDGIGLEVSWWNENDLQLFEEKVERLKQSISRYFYIDDYLDGEQFLSETLADIISTSIILDYALSNDLDIRQVMIYKAYTRGRRTNLEGAREYLYGVHPPSIFRVNFVLQQFDIFHKTFETQLGDDMYLPIADRLVIW